MSRKHLVPCLVAVVVGAALLVAFGAEPGTLLYGAAALACPLMMIFMMWGMHGMHGRHGAQGSHGGQGGVDHSAGSATGERERTP